MKKTFLVSLTLFLLSGCTGNFPTWKELNETWINNNEVQLGIDPYVLESGVLASGVQYEIYHNGYGAIPKPGYDPGTEMPNSYVIVNYTGWLVDGTKFD